jgi:ABC-type Fe3+-siderophore transport system permease subunit
MVPYESPSAERLDMLKLLYPWYKEEVYRRRQQMIWLTVLGALVLVLLLFLIASLPIRPLHREWTVLAGCAVVIFSAAMISFILQQRVRHRMAKQVLIAIEQGLGLYGQDHQAADALYPQGWQHAWREDRTVWVYLTVMVILTALDLFALMLR